MGYGLQVELDLEIEDVPDFLHWSSKGMLDALAMDYEVHGFCSILDNVAERLNLDVSLLHKVTNPERNLNDFIGGIDPDDQEELKKWEQEFRDFEQRREIAWQPPTGIRECIEALIQELDNHPNVYEEVGVDPDPYGNYFLLGAFRRDLDKLHKIVSWADQNEVPQLRLIWL